VIAYLDTSALVKLYVDETGSTAVRACVERASLVATSRVAYVEALAALARKRREGEFTQEEHERARGAFESDWANYFVIEVSERVTESGGKLIGQFALRGFDALHLASALLVREHTRTEVVFACFDRALNDAAQAAGLSPLQGV